MRKEWLNFHSVINLTVICTWVHLFYPAVAHRKISNPKGNNSVLLKSREALYRVYINNKTLLLSFGFQYKNIQSATAFSILCIFTSTCTLFWTWGWKWSAYEKLKVDLVYSWFGSGPLKRQIAFPVLQAGTGSILRRRPWASLSYSEVLRSGSLYWPGLSVLPLLRGGVSWEIWPLFSWVGGASGGMEDPMYKSMRAFVR